MRGKRKDLPSTHSGMLELLQAEFERVRGGTPSHPDLIELLRLGKLKVSAANVAKEAGVSRSLLGHENCRYHQIYAQIISIGAPATQPSDMRGVNADLRKINRELEARVRSAQTEQAALINRMRLLEKEYEDKVREIERIKSRAGRDPNNIIGLKIVPKSEQG